MVAQDRWTRVLTTGNTRHSSRSYLGAPGSRRRWRRERWSSGPCPCGRWPGWSRSGARCSRRGSGTGRCWGTGPRRCRSCRAAQRTPCTRTVGLRRSPGSCVLQGSCTHQGRMAPLDWDKTATTGSTEDFKTHFGDTFCIVSEAATGSYVKLWQIIAFPEAAIAWAPHLQTLISGAFRIQVVPLLSARLSLWEPAGLASAVLAGQDKLCCGCWDFLLVPGYLRSQEEASDPAWTE